MPTTTYIESMGIVLVAIVSAILGKEYGIDFLSNTVPAGLFGAALGYLGGAARQAGQDK